MRGSYLQLKFKHIICSITLHLKFNVFLNKHQFGFHPNKLYFAWV